jgi:hypothetical protein
VRRRDGQRGEVERLGCAGRAPACRRCVAPRSRRVDPNRRGRAGRREAAHLGGGGAALCGRAGRGEAAYLGGGGADRCGRRKAADLGRRGTAGGLRDGGGDSTSRGHVDAPVRHRGTRRREATNLRYRHGVVQCRAIGVVRLGAAGGAVARQVRPFSTVTIGWGTDVARVRAPAGGLGIPRGSDRGRIHEFRDRSVTRTAGR